MATTQPALGFNGGIIRFGEEVTWGTEVARTNQIECESLGLSKTDEPKLVEVIPKRYGLIDEVYQGVTVVGGDFSFPFRYEGAEILLKHLLGSVVTTNPGTLAYLHTFSFSDIILEGLSFEKLIDANLTTGKSMLYTGGKINSMDFTLEPDGILMVSANIIAKDEELEETPTSLTSSVSPLAVFYQSIVTLASGAITCKVLSFNLSVNNNLASDRHRLCSRNIQQPVPSGKAEITGTMTIEFDADTYYTLFENQTTTDINLTLTGAEIESSYEYSISFDMPYCKISGFSVNPEDQNIVIVEMPFRAFANSSSQRELSIAVQNTLVSI